MARTSLLLVLLQMSTQGCLITDPPQFNPPKHSRPFLLAETATPDTRTIVNVDSANLPPNGVEFSAAVVSQDDVGDPTSAFRQVFVRLLIDYGFSGAGGAPYRLVFNGQNLSPANLSDASRRASASFYPPSDLDSGCHTATLVVSHIFDDVIDCPVCSDDYTFITWQIIHCDSSQGNCDTLPITDPVMGCHDGRTTMSCDTIRGSRLEACPEDQDGGTP